MKQALIQTPVQTLVKAPVLMPSASPTVPAARHGAEWGRSALLAAWFLLVIVGFFGPYLHLPVASTLLWKLYGVYLMCAIAAAALTLLRWARGEKPIDENEASHGG